MVRQSSVALPMSRRVAPTAAQEGGLSPVESASAQTPEPPKARPKRQAPVGDLGPIIKSKIQPPALRQATLSRQRLIDRLIEATSHRLTLLVAEAGYGKTTLLADFARVTTARVLWYRLDAADGEVVDWVSYLISAFRDIEPAFGFATANLLAEISTGGPPKNAFMASLISELGGLEPQATVLVLDDFHVVDHLPDAAVLIGQLLRDAPPWLAIVIASRRHPDLETSKLAASGELAEVGTADLRFTKDEIERLFETSYATPLDDDVVLTLVSRTMGWAASLQLFYGSIRGRPPTRIRSVARALSGASSPVYDFLAEEVLGDLDGDIRRFLVRASLLDRFSAREVAALHGDLYGPPSESTAQEWIDHAERLALIGSSSITSEKRQFHPLMREFLFRQLCECESEQDIRAMHLRVAQALASDDPLTAAGHYLEAGDAVASMESLNSSLMLTIGSGRWGAAYQLISRLQGIPAGPAVAAIQARQLMGEGDLAGAAEILDSADVSNAPAEVRAQFRFTMFSLGWRTGEQDRMVGALDSIKHDPDAPSALREVAELMLDANPARRPAQSLPAIAHRLQAVAATMANQRLTFYSAISLHDSAVAYLNAGEFVRSLEAGSQALDQFGHLAFFAVEQLSTHAAMAQCEAELGNEQASEAHSVVALSRGDETADVPAELAALAVLQGDTDRAISLIARAKALQGQHRSDPVADGVLDCAEALLEFRSALPDAVYRLDTVRFDSPFELGYSSLRDALLVQGLMLSGDEGRARTLTMSALARASSHKEARAEGRLAVLNALIERDQSSLNVAIGIAERLGGLTLLELADVLLSRLELLSPLPDALDRSIRKYPGRWLPGIRKLIETGNTPLGRAAANLLDTYGTVGDVGLLRAYAKTYVRKGPGRTLGQALARRTSPTLEVHDLGGTTLTVGARVISRSAIRRKSASVLMYLVTRSGFTANREQVVENLWPESDPDSSSNNLNQSLYFLRREIDPWYEDDLSVDYVGLQGELVWLDRDLVRADSARFLERVARRPSTAADLATELFAYSGQFAPEFEYDEWAMAWRGYVHSTFLDTVHSVLDELTSGGDFRLAADVAAHAIRVDPTAADIETRLVWIYGRMGRLSAARRQYDHLERQDRLDGLEPKALAELLKSPYGT